MHIYQHLKSHLLSHQKENIFLMTKLHLTVLIFTKKQKYVLLTRQYVITNVKYTKQNRNFVNFIKYKIEYTVITIIPIVEYLYIYIKTTLLTTLLAKNITLIKRECRKRSMK